MAKKQLDTSGVDMSVFQKKSLNTEGVDMSVFDVKKKDSGDEVSPSLEEPTISEERRELSFQNERPSTVPNYMGLFDNKKKVELATSLGVSVDFYDKVDKAAQRAERPTEFLFKVNDLTKRLDKIPEYFPQLDTEAKQIKSELVDVDSRNIEDISAKVSRLENRVFRSPMSYGIAQGAGGDANWINYENEVINNPQSLATQRLIDSTEDIRSAADVEDDTFVDKDKSVLSGVGKGLEAWITDWGKLIDDLRSNPAVKKLQDKLETEDTDKKEFWESLSTEERLLLKAMQDNYEASKNLLEKVPKSYKIGEAVGQSIGFMAEFAATAGVGAGAAASIRGVVGAGKVAKFGANALAKIAQSGIQTAAMPTLYKNIAIDVSKGESFGESMLNNYWELGAETLSERIFLRNPSSTEALGAADKIFRMMGTNLSTKKGFTGLLKNIAEEDTEEKLSEIMTAPKNYKDFNAFWNGFTDKEQNSIMLGSVALMVGVPGSAVVTADKVGKVRDKLQLQKLENVIPADLRQEVDVVLGDKELGVKDQLDLIMNNVKERAAVEELGEKPNEMAANVMRYAHLKTKGIVQETAEKEKWAEQRESPIEGEGAKDVVEPEIEAEEVEPKIEQDGKEMQVSESEREDVPESETQAAEGGATEAEAVEAAGAEAVGRGVEPAIQDVLSGLEESGYETRFVRGDGKYVSTFKRIVSDKEQDELRKTLDDGGRVKIGESIDLYVDENGVVTKTTKPYYMRGRAYSSSAKPNITFAYGEETENKVEVVKPTTAPQKPSERVSSGKGVTTPPAEKVAETAPTQAETAKVEQGAGIKPKNVRDVYKAGREVFGLNRAQALAQAVVVDRIIGKIAKRRGVSKGKVYSDVEFRRGLAKEGVKAPQGAKGAISIMSDGRAVISALTDPNVSTPLHEIAHLYERYMDDAERNTVLKWAKHKEWTTETSEKFARGFEKYLAEGKAPNTALQKVFDRFKEWLTDIYNGITGSEIDIELNDAMRGVYSAMLGEGVVKTKKRTAAETKPSTTGFDDVDALLFQDVLFQGEDKTEKHTKAVNLLVDKAESAKEDVVKFVREKLANAGNPVREEIITNVLKERGYAKEKQSGKMRSEGKQKQPKGKGDSDLSEVDRAELQDRKKDKKVSQFGKRFFTATSQVSEEVQDLIVEKGIHLYEPTSLEEAVTVAKEMASNLSYEELKDIITSNRKMNEAVRANIAIQTLKKSTAEMRQNSKNGVSSPYLVNLQLEVLRSLKDNVSAAGLLMRATQGDEFTEYIAPDAWVQDYIDTVLGSRRTSMKEKWFNRASDLFDKKAKRAVSESVSETMDAPKVKKEIEKSKKRKPKAPKSEAAKKRNDIVAKWKKSLENRKTLFQAARSEFVWMEEDIQFARDVVQTYIEDGVYNRNVLAEKLSMQFESLGLPVEEEVLRRIIPDEFNGVPLDELFERQQLDKAAESLATRIFGSVIETKKKDDPLLQMVNTLLSKFKERTETKEVKKKTDLEKVVDAISRVSDYKEVWKEARDLAIDKVDANESLESIQKELAKEKINYAYDNATKFTFTENQIRGVVRDAIRKKEINLDDLVRSHMSVRGATRETLRNFIIDSSGLDAEGAKTLSDAVYGVYERMLTQRATNIVSKEAKKMGDKVSGKEFEKRIVATETERLLDMILLKAFENDEFRNAYASVKGIPRITEDHVANIEMLADKVRETPSTGVKRMRKDDLLMYMRRLEGVSIQEALDTLWFAAVLSGVPTQVRNAYGAFGNVYGDLFLKIASNPLKAADIIKSQSRGFRFGRTKAGVIWRTGKYFFENRTDAPMASEYAVDKDSSWTNPFKFAAYLMRFMSANDQLALSVGKEAYATLLANEQKNVNYFKKAFSKEYRRRINEEVERVLGLSKEQLDEFDRIVKEESEEYGYDINEQKIRKQELIDEARPLELVKDAETIAAELTGNTKAYGTIGYLIEQIAKPLRSFTVNIKVRGKDYAIHPTKLLAVFTKISTNVATTQLSFTPFGFMNVLAGKHGFLPKDNPFIREMSPAKKRIHIARATAGTVLIGLIWGLMNPDDEDHWFQLTANGTGNYKDEKELRRIGWRPYSVFIGGYDGIRVSYRYTPFALLMAPLGYMSDRKRFTKKGKEKSEFELVAWAMTDVFTYIADNTPLSGMLNFMNDIIGGIRGASDMAESGKDGAKAVAKAFLNIPKGIYGAGIVRSVIDTWDSFTRDERMENNKIYNDYIDRTVFEILPWEEDNFPARDSWGLPMKQYRTLDEFFGLRDEDQFASLREFHYEQGAGVVGMPNRNQLLFRVKFADGTQQYISLSRNNKNHRYLWNEVFLKKRGEYMRESMTSLKNTGYKNERYVEEFSKRKTKDQNNAKEDVYRYTLNKPLPVSEKNKE